MSDERPNTILDRAKMLHEERERDRKNWAAFGNSIESASVKQDVEADRLRLAEWHLYHIAALADKHGRGKCEFTEVTEAIDEARAHLRSVIAGT
jgi:hypothetical protein